MSSGKSTKQQKSPSTPRKQITEPKVQRVRKGGLMKVVLFVCRLKQSSSPSSFAQSARRKLSRQQHISTTPTADEFPEEPGSPPPGPSDKSIWSSGEDELIEKYLPRGATVPTIDIDPSLLSSEESNSRGSFSLSSSRCSSRASRNTLPAEYGLSVPKYIPGKRGSNTGSYLSLPTSFGSRSRSNSNASVSSALSGRMTAEPDIVPRKIVNFTGMDKPYSVKLVGTSKDSRNPKTITVVHKSKPPLPTMSASTVEKSPTSFPKSKSRNRLVRRLSQRDNPMGGSADTETLWGTPLRSRRANVMFKTGWKSTSDDYSQSRSVADLSPITMRKINKRRSSGDILDETSRAMTKSDRKKLEQFHGAQQDSKELFTAVEQDDIGKVRIMLARNDTDVCSANVDDWTLLDVALMLNHKEVAQLLLKHGAQENPRLSAVQARQRHLQVLIENAQTKLTELNYKSQSTSSPIKDLDRQISLCESRLHSLKKMRGNFDTMHPPSEPKNVTLYVRSSTSLGLQFEPADPNAQIVTKYKVEWSRDPEFHRVEGCTTLSDLRRLELVVSRLQSAITVWVRVSAGNIKGFSQATPTFPEYATPSSWQTVLGRDEPRFFSQLSNLKKLFREFQETKNSKKFFKFSNVNDDQTQKKKKGSLRSLFLGSSKFTRNLKKGVYLATVIYHDACIVCTVDDTLPIVEVDATNTDLKSLNSDFMWFYKLSCYWDDLKSLVVDQEASHNSSSIQFRLRLIEAAQAMQECLGMKDIGRLQFPWISDENGTTILVTVQNVDDIRRVQAVATKWITMSKFVRKQSPASSDGLQNLNTAFDLLNSKFLDHINFNETANTPLDRGLYLGYVKMYSSMNQMHLLVPENLPSALPFVLIRENPHVSEEEWSWIRNFSSLSQSTQPSPTQLAFHWSLVSAARVLLDDLDLSEDESSFHRLYTLEVIEVHPDISFVVLVPPRDDVCSAPGQLVPGAAKRGCTRLPVPVFEMVHFSTYHLDFVTTYCRFSAIIELYAQTAQHVSRTALVDKDHQQSKDWLDILGYFKDQIEELWRSVRWVTDVATAARDKQLECAALISDLINYSGFALSRRGSPAAAFQAIEEASPTGELPNGEAAFDLETNEENSDVGYHSDQSVEKTIENGESQNPSGHHAPTMNTLQLQAVADNPTYGQLGPPPSHSMLDTVITPTTNGGTYTISDSSYMNLFELSQLKQLQMDTSASNSITTVGGGRRQVIRTSFLQHQNKTTIRRLVDYTEDSVDEAGVQDDSTLRSFTTQIPIGASGKPAPVQNNLVAGDSVDGIQLLSVNNTAMIGPSSHVIGFGSSSSFDSKSSSTEMGNTSDGQFTRPASSASAARKVTPVVHEYVNYRSESEMEGRNRRPYVPPKLIAKVTPVYSSASESNSEADSKIRLKVHPGYVNLVPPEAVSSNESDIDAKFSAARERFRRESVSKHHPELATTQPYEDLSAIDKLYVNATSLSPNASPEVGTRSTKLMSVPNLLPGVNMLRCIPSAAASSASSISGSSISPVSQTSVSDPQPQPQQPSGGILRVHAAYETGLSRGTSVKLQVTPRTTSKEVVKLVVQQLNYAAEMKGKQAAIHADDELFEFCLVAVIGSRERCFRDDFKPLELQNPWTKGRLFVRKRNDVLAALEFGNSATV